MNRFKRKYYNIMLNNKLKIELTIRNTIHFITDLNGMTNIYFFYFLENRIYQKSIICFMQIFKKNKQFY